MLKYHISTLTAVVLLGLSLQAEEVDLSGFDDVPVITEETEVAQDSLLDGFDESDILEAQETQESIVTGLTGKLTEQIAYSINNDKPHDNISSVKSSLLLDYEHKFENGFKFKANAKAYYDAIYDIKGTHKFSTQELDELKSEVELFDAYIEGSVTDSLDVKFGRQVIVWGRSDTIRVTDVLNPLDNRRPGMVDIEDLRLPVTMAKLDYFIGDWRVTPIAVLEQRFTKNPPFGGDFFPAPFALPNDESYKDITYALSIGGEFSGWDVNFYASRLRDDSGYLSSLPTPSIKHDKVNMFGTALNFLTGSWLFKTEFAYFDGLKYTSASDKTFSRGDLLLGVEYNGFADTLISYDVAVKKIYAYDDRLLNELSALERNTYQHAFRVSKDFMNATINANYLVSLFGAALDEGGFQRAWIKYDLADGVNINAGVVEYIGGSSLFDIIEDNDMVFADISYSF